MQSHIQSMWSQNPGWLAGCFLLGVMGIYSLALCYGAFRRLYFERGQRALARECLLEEIRAAKVRFQEAEQVKQIWNGFRKFGVSKKVIECDGVASFYLTPHDKNPLPPFKPGQYLTFQLNIPGESKAVVRCYSLSDAHRPDCYRVTIKKALPPADIADARPGLGSSYFYDVVKEGDILDVRAPGGHFFLDMSNERPIVLISGGVGVTPMFSMLNAVLAAKSNREVWFFFGVRNRLDHIFKELLEKIAAENPHVHFNICYSRPEKDDVQGRDYHHKGRVSVELFKQLLPSSNYDYYMCGPDVFMDTITNDLIAWGVPKDHVHKEAFGPAVKPKGPALTNTTIFTKSALKVTFARSGTTVSWNPSAVSLLDFAEANGAKIDSGCRVGNCGSCLVAVKSGEVEYDTDPGAAAEAGSCLTCICKPKTDLVIDA